MAAKKNSKMKKDDGSIGVFVKIAPEVKIQLDKVAERHNRTKSELIESVIRYFAHLESSEQEAIILEQYKTLINMEADIQEANHAFQIGHWLHAVEAHERLLKTSKNINRFENWINYRLAYCWVEIAIERRKTALQNYLKKPSKDLWQNQFKITMHCIDKSIAHGKAALGGPPSQLLTLYNLACTYGIKCQYIMERVFLQRDLSVPTDYRVTIEDLLLNKKELADHVDKYLPDHRAAVKLFDAFYKDNSSHYICEYVVETAEKAFSHLETIFSSTEEPDADGHSTNNAILSWVHQNALIDQDLAFLREASFIGKKFNILYTDEKDSITEWCNRKLGTVI